MSISYTKTIEQQNLSLPALEGDIGSNLVCHSLVKKLGENTFMYDTGICISPPKGYYVEVVPRSSISKTGYVLANSMGVIDPGYTGSLKVVLTRVDSSIPELSVPFSVCQMILRKTNLITDLELLDYVEFQKKFESKRGTGGFGSTG